MSPILPQGLTPVPVITRWWDGRMRTAVADRWRFDRKVVWSPTCLWWVGAIADDGYGRFATGTGRVMSAHRWLWEQDVGPLPAGVRLRHCCDETSCVRLAHLIPGSHRLNMGDMTRRGRAGGPYHHGRADVRGAAGRARAIRAALTAATTPTGSPPPSPPANPGAISSLCSPTPTPAEPPRQRAAPGAAAAAPPPPQADHGADQLHPAGAVPLSE